MQKPRVMNNSKGRIIFKMNDDEFFWGLDLWLPIPISLLKANDFELVCWSLKKDNWQFWCLIFRPSVHELPATQMLWNPMLESSKSECINNPSKQQDKASMKSWLYCLNAFITFKTKTFCKEEMVHMIVILHQEMEKRDSPNICNIGSTAIICHKKICNVGSTQPSHVLSLRVSIHIQTDRILDFVTKSQCAYLN